MEKSPTSSSPKTPRKPAPSGERHELPFHVYHVDLRITPSEWMYHDVLQGLMADEVIDFGTAITMEYLMIRNGYTLVD